MTTMYGYLIVFFGAGLGGALRHLTNLVTQRALGPDLPVSTLLVNVVGSLSLGAIAGHFALRGHGSQALQLFLTTGILGGFTTFSAFGNETMNLWRDGQNALAALNIAAHLVLGLGAVWIGRALAYQIWR